MKIIKRITAIMLTVLIAVSDRNLITMNAATAKGTTLRLEQTEGTATLKNANGTAKSIKTGMKLYNGDNVTTDKSSYAYISLDGTKAVKTDENSSVTIKQNGTENEVMVDSGSLIFNVTVPLEKKESLNIRTSTMITGVRGTIGFAKKISDEESEIYILEGKVELTSVNSKSGEAKSVFITAGEKGVCRRVKAFFGKKTGLQVPEVKPENFTEENIPDFVVIEIGRNKDIQDRLKKGGVFDVDKILKRYGEMGDTGNYITIGTVVSTNSVSANTVSTNTVTPNTVSDNKPAGAVGGGSGGGGGAGGGGAGGSGNEEAPKTAPVITISSVSGSGHYTYGDALNPVQVSVAENADVITEYQWYVANDEATEGTLIDGAKGSSQTPQTVAGTRYYYCIVTQKLKSDETKVSQKTSDRVAVIIDKRPNTQKTKAPVEPVDEQIGFTSITLEEVTELELSSVSPITGSEKNLGNKITLMETSHENKQAVRLDTPVFNDPGDTVSPSAVEYAKNDNATAPTDDDAWQSSRTFTGLSMGTTYYFFARIAATESTEAGKPSEAISITTKKADDFTERFDNENYLHFILKDLDKYDGSVSANAIVECVSSNSAYQGNEYPHITIPATIKVYDLDIKVTEIAKHGFADFSIMNENYYKAVKVGSITLPDTIEKIGEGAFAETPLSSINIPDSVKEIGDSAFEVCSNLTSIDIGDGCEIIGSNAFTYCDNITSLKLGKNVREIKDFAFWHCDKIEQVDFPEKLELIGKSAFQDCELLQKAEFKEGLKYIGERAFVYCDALTEVVIPSTVKVVSGNAYDDAPFGKDPLNNSNADLTIYCGKKSANDIPAEWGDFWKAKKISSTNNESHTVYWYESVENKTVNVYSNGAVYKENSSVIAEAKQLSFPVSYDSYSHVVSGHINSAFLKKMLDLYDTVVIPEDNVAVLDADLTIPKSKTLKLEGDLSTEYYDFDKQGIYGKDHTTDYTEIKGSLINEGTLIVEGNFYTSTGKMTCTHTQNTDYTMISSSTVKSAGTILLSGKMTVFYSVFDKDDEYTDAWDDLQIDKIEMSKGSELNIYADGSDQTGLESHITDFSNTGQTVINGLKLKGVESNYEFVFSTDSSSTVKLDFDYSNDDTGKRYKMQISDGEHTGTVYNEYVPNS